MEITPTSVLLGEKAPGGQGHSAIWGFGDFSAGEVCILYLAQPLFRWLLKYQKCLIFLLTAGYCWWQFSLAFLLSALLNLTQNTRHAGGKLLLSERGTMTQLSYTTKKSILNQTIEYLHWSCWFRTWDNFDHSWMKLANRPSHSSCAPEVQVVLTHLA